MFSTAVDLGAAGRDIYYGYGRVNAAAAVNAVRATAPVADIQKPTSAITSPAASSSVSGLVTVNVAASDNVGVTLVELKANGTVVGTDSASPFSFSWNSANSVNGMVSLVATSYDAAGNATASTPVSVNVANAVTPPAKDTTPPVVKIDNPSAGTVSGQVSVRVSASDNSGAAGIAESLYIDNALVATGKGGALAYTWRTRQFTKGAHTVTAVAKDAAGNSASASVTVTVAR
jgi:thermitase